MRIRTRYRVFQAVIALALSVFALSLYDMFLNDSELQIYVLAAYAVLAVAGLLFYLGYKPTLVEEVPITAEERGPTPETEGFAEAAQAEEEAAVELEEVPKRRPVSGLHVEGPHHFRCPFCSHTFGLEATHLDRRYDFRLNCPYCANNIRIPRAPKVAPGSLKRIAHAAPSDRVLYACNACGEVLRFTAPESRLERALAVTTCPNCRSASLALAAT